MIIIPAIDIIDGACVRLIKGKFETKKKYYDDPLEVAWKWKNQGAEWLHIIDLDGAKSGRIQNLEIAVKIKQEIGIKVEFGGGIRDLKALCTQLTNNAIMMLKEQVLLTEAVKSLLQHQKAMDKIINTKYNIVTANDDDILN